MERKFLVVLLVVAMFFVSGPQALLPAQPTLFVDSDGGGVGDNEESTGRAFSINPVNGTSAGGTELTVTGAGFDSLIPEDADNRIWSIYTINADSGGNGPLSITVDMPEDKLYAMYTEGGDMRLVSNSNGVWSNLLYFNSGSWPSLAMNQETNHVMIAYHEEANSDLKGAHWNPSVSGGGGATLDGDSGVDVGEYASNAICTQSMTYCGATSDTDYRHISYYDETNGDLKRAWYNGVWNTQTIDSEGDVGLYTSIALDSLGAIHISYLDKTNDDLKYATSTSGNEGTWQTTTVDTIGDVGIYGSIAIDSNDEVHISYHDQTNGNLKYA